MTFQLRRPDDFHVHFRQDDMLQCVVPHTASQFARALVMPNTTPPVRTADDVARYRREILDAAGPGFAPLLTIKLLSDTSPEVVRAARAAGAVAAKLYPVGVTTSAEDGIHLEYFPHNLEGTLRAMEEVGMVLSIHGERPGRFCLDRERVFLPILRTLSARFPKLKIVLEHITTAAAANAVVRLPRTVAATITVHHLVLTLDDVIGDSIRPHHFCKPVAKFPDDRECLQACAVSGSPKFFLGTDSAPHPVRQKECAAGCAGAFTAPVALPLLVELFEQWNALARLEDFVARFGAEFYNLPLNDGTVELVREEWTVPDRCGDLIPFMAGKTLAWRVRAAQ